MSRAAALCTVVLLLSGSCKTQRLGNKGCEVDSDCGNPATAYRCEAATGVCYCRTDEPCPAGQFCNTIGFCQDRAGCEKNADCLDSTLYCDTASGSCIAKGRCSSDLQCPLGQVCDPKKTACVDGCRKSGDCSGAACRCGDVACNCTGSTPEELAKCTVGECDPYFCANPDDCRFGEVCASQPDAGMPRAQCSSDYDQNVRPYCDGCTFGAGTNICGTGANYCLIDTRNPGNSFCGTDCSMGQSCPRGYGCQDVIVVFQQWACSRANPACPINPSLPCMSDADCRRGGSCAKQPGQTSGFCQGKCGVDEGDSQGFCTCQVDADCAQETCTAGECSISRRKCVNDSDCRAIRCVDFQGGGGCLIGQNCAPNDGLSCVDVR